MIHEVDAGLGQFITDEVLDGSDVEVAFDAPTKDWTSRRNAPTVNIFLYDVREDLARRDVAPVRISGDGRVTTDRMAPPRRFKLAYLLTAWTQRPEDEHRLLAQLLTNLIKHDRIPPQYLSGSLAELGMPVLMGLALPPPQDRSLSDIWSALGGEMKPSIDLVLNAPLEPGRHWHVGPPALETPRIHLADPEGDAAPAPARGRGKKGGSKPADAPRRPAAVADPDQHDVEVVQAGTDDQPGRTLKVRRLGRP
jgi:hypothetical protein